MSTICIPSFLLTAHKKECKVTKGACDSDKVHNKTADQAKKNNITCLKSTETPKHVAIFGS